MKKLVIFINDASFFLSHRLPIAKKAKESGYDVHVISSSEPPTDFFKEYGLHYHKIVFSRGGINPFFELIGFFNIIYLLWRIKPDVLHLVTIKPVLYGSLAARVSPVKRVVAALSGLGYIYTSEKKLISWVRKVVSLCMKIGFSKKNLEVIFQNKTDRALLVKQSIVEADKTVIIRGSGVEMADYPVLPEPQNDNVIVTFAARLLFDKGIREYVEAASVLADKKLPITFQIVGDIDPSNPTSVTNADLIEWAKRPNIKVVGYRKDIASVFAASNIVVLPSYREGLPKVLIEAAACGRAVITTDVPGCRDAITKDETGLLVPVKDSASLALAIEKLAADSDLRASMGRAGRKLAEDAFTIQSVVQKHMEIYQEAGH